MTDIDGGMYCTQNGECRTTTRGDGWTCGSKLVEFVEIWRTCGPKLVNECVVKTGRDRRALAKGSPRVESGHVVPSGSK